MMLDQESKRPKATGPHDTLAASFEEVRSLTDRLCAPLAIEDYGVQSMPDASPVKWHLAHTTWFFETFVLAESNPDYQPFHPRFGYLFNSYYNALGAFWPREQRGLLSRPTVAEVFGYRNHVDVSLRTVAEPGRTSGCPCRDAPADRTRSEPRAAASGADADRSQARLRLQPFAARLPGPVETAPTGAVAPRVAPLSRRPALAGTRRRRDSAYDNEGPRHRVFVGPFQLASRLVTRRRLPSPSSRTAAISVPNSGCPTAGRRAAREDWQAPLYWERRDDVAGSA